MSLGDQDCDTGAIRFLVVSLTALAGCISPGSSICGDLFCPADSVCVDGLIGCFEPGVVEACEGRADDELCEFDGSSGRCNRGVCVSATCGDGVVEAPEVCDDGNDTGGDSCSADCLTASCLVPVSHATLTELVADLECPVGYVASGRHVGTTTIDRSITIQGVGSGEAILDGASDGSTLEVVSGTSILRDLVVTGGEADRGGGVFNMATLTLERVVVRDNRAISSGGGIYHESGFLLVTESTISGNRVDGSRDPFGGGVAAFAPLAITNGTRVEQNRVLGLGTAAAGGLFASRTTVVIADSQFEDNAVTGTGLAAVGGGLFTSEATVSAEAMTVSSNLVTIETPSQVLAGGGGAYFSGGTLTTSRSLVTDNRIEAGGLENTFVAGGGIGVAGTANVTMVGDEIRDNEIAFDAAAPGLRAAVGGGISFEHGARGVVRSATIANNTIRGTATTTIAGGGFGVAASSPDTSMIIIDTLVDGNQVTGGDPVTGGGLGLIATDSSTYELSILRSAFVRNGGATAGGGLGFISSGQLSVLLADSTVSGNLGSTTATTFGGGLSFLEISTGLLAGLVLHSTVTNNGATEGGGIWVGDADVTRPISVVAESSIVYDNAATIGPDCRSSAGVELGGAFSILGDIADCTLVDPAGWTIADPMISTLADNGGPTPTHAISAQSPAVNNANGQACTETDQRGVARPASNCDIGAFEL